jgi:regulatory protein
MMNERRQPGRPRKSATEKIMDLLAKRNHSELELRQKLSRSCTLSDAPAYSEAEIEQAIAFARDNNWMLPPEEIAERTAIELGRKRKGHRFINQFLKTKGLPPVTRDADEEFRKALDVVDSKLGPSWHLDRTENGEGQPLLDYDAKKKINQKIYRLLANRGFDDETIRRVLDAR